MFFGSSQRDSFVRYLFGGFLILSLDIFLKKVFLWAYHPYCQPILNHESLMRRFTGTMDILCQRSRSLRDPGQLHSFVLKIRFQDKIVDSLSELGYALQCPVSCLRLFHCGCSVNLSPSFRWGDVPGIVWCPFCHNC